ncbi:hypothetical protein [Kitasatospora sp. NPDC056789]|uniref:hypothetical protein n=1 Tax=Kitasatospora sp. NPDC056789 TaxID=3345945 RepID=UPI0036B75F54
MAAALDARGVGQHALAAVRQLRDQRGAALLDGQVPSARHDLADRGAGRVVLRGQLARGRDGEPERLEVRRRGGRLLRGRDRLRGRGAGVVRLGGLDRLAGLRLAGARVAVAALAAERRVVALGRVAVLAGLAGGTRLTGLARVAVLAGDGRRAVGGQRGLQCGHQGARGGRAGQREQRDEAEPGAEAVADDGAGGAAAERPDRGPQRRDGEGDAPLVQPQAEHLAVGRGRTLEALHQDQHRGGDAEEVDRRQDGEQVRAPRVLRRRAVPAVAAVHGPVRQEGGDEEQDGRACDGGVSPGESAQIH